MIIKVNGVEVTVSEGSNVTVNETGRVFVVAPAVLIEGADGSKTFSKNLEVRQGDAPDSVRRRSMNNLADARDVEKLVADVKMIQDAIPMRNNQVEKLQKRVEALEQFTKHLVNI